MKIEQNSKTGQVFYKLSSGEEYSFDEHLSAMSNFLNEQAVEIFRLKDSYRRLIDEFDEIKLISNKNGTSAIDKQL